MLTVEAALMKPCHLQSQVKEARHDINRQEVIKEHPINETTLWTSTIFGTPKHDGKIQI